MILNFHNLVKIKILAKKDISDIEKWFLFFRESTTKDSDILLSYRPFKIKKENLYSIDNSFYIVKNKIYAEKKDGKVFWKLLFKFLEEKNKFYVNFYCTSKKFHLLYPNFLLKELIIRLLEVYLSFKYHLLVHSAGVCKDNKGLLLVGRGGSFKTTLAMDLIRKYNFSLLGDDHVILSKKTLFCFPENLQIFSFMLNNLRTEKDWNFFNKFRFIRELIFKKNTSFNFIASASPLKGIIFIQKKNRFSYRIYEKEKSDFLERILYNNLMEDFITLTNLGMNKGFFSNLLCAYSYIYPKSKFSNYSSFFKNALRFIKGVPILFLDLPVVYNEKVVDLINDFFNTL